MGGVYDWLSLVTTVSKTVSKLLPHFLDTMSTISKQRLQIKDISYILDRNMSGLHAMFFIIVNVFIGLLGFLKVWRACALSPSYFIKERNQRKMAAFLT